MADHLFENMTYESVSFEKEKLPPGLYDNCKFISCDLSQLELEGHRFIDCEFDGCNLSLLVLRDVVMRDTDFRRCKMTGTRFDQLHPVMISFRFEQCLLQLSSFAGLKIPGTYFADCDLKESDFSGTDLTGAVFRRVNLFGAVFDNTLLEKADLRQADHYVIDPERNHVAGARVSADGITGFLDKYRLVIE